MTKDPEQELQDEMVDFLLERGYKKEGIKHIPRQVSKKSRGIKGFLDLHVIGNGVSFEVEVKHPEKPLNFNSLRQSQVDRIRLLRENRLSHGVFNDLETFKEFVEEVELHSPIYCQEYSGIDEDLFDI
jgi:hypothetical protein